MNGSFVGANNFCAPANGFFTLANAPIARASNSFEVKKEVKKGITLFVMLLGECSVGEIQSRSRAALGLRLARSAGRRENSANVIG
jgi:hypothetical protein